MKEGADVNAKVLKIGLTPLHCAFRSKSKDIAKLLIKYGANLLAQDTEGNTPVHYAIRYCNTTLSECESSSSNEYGLSCSKSGRKSDHLIDFEANPDYSAALEIKNKKGLNPKEMIDIGLQQVVEKLAFAFFEKKDKKSSSRNSNSISNKENLNSNTEEGKENKKTKGKITQKKVKLKKIHSTNLPGLHFLQQQISPNTAHKCYATTEIGSEENSNRSEISSARCGDIPSERAKDQSRIGLELYKVLKLLGKGSFGEVYLVQHKKTNELYAMKIIQKSKIMSQNLVRYAVTEKKVMSQTNHPFIVKLRSAFQTKERLFLIMDYCPGGDLSQYLIREKRFTEERARIYISEIILAIEDLHKRNIIFRYLVRHDYLIRDIKPDNVVLDKDGHAMLTDFGLSKEGIEGPVDAKSFCGSIAYLAPEILKRTGHGKSVDWYLMGVLLYEMLIGHPPYLSNKR